MPRATVLLTRPQDASRRFAAMLPEGVPVVISPILDIVDLPHDADRLAAAEGLVFTSAHAVGAAGPGRDRLAFCVGGRTAVVARTAGFDVIEGPGDAQGLLPLIAASPVPLIHARGRHVAHRLPVEEIVVYDQRALPLSEAALRHLSVAAPVILPLFSARSARLLADALPERVVAPLYLAAISESVLAAWQGPRERTAVALQPDADGMRNAVISLMSWEQ